MDSRIWWLIGAVLAVVLVVALMSPREPTETATVPTTNPPTSTAPSSPTPPVTPTPEATPPAPSGAPKQ